MIEIKVACDVKDTVSLDELAPFQGELKSLSKDDYAKLRHEIMTTGFAFPVFAWRAPDGVKIIGGHQRVRVLQELAKSENAHLPLDQVPVVFVDAQDEREARRRVLQDVAQFGKVEGEGLYEFMSQAEISIEGLKDSFRLPDVHIESFELEYFKDNTVPPAEDPGAGAPPKIAKTVPGDLWILGNHRLLCGDSTRQDLIDRLMDGKRAEICFTSPPYNVGKNASLRGTGKESLYNENSDHKSSEEYRQFLIDFTTIAMSVSDVVFVNVQLLAGNKLAIPEYWHHFRGQLIDLLIWDKEHAAPAMAENVMNSVFELVFAFTMQAAEPKRTMFRAPAFRGTVDNIFRLSPIGKKDELAKDHGAVFPLEFAAHFISKFSQGSVFEPFGGSGTTLIASEQLGRSSFVMELDPAYCDVIIERWQRLTGQAAHREDGVQWSEL